MLKAAKQGLGAALVAGAAALLSLLGLQSTAHAQSGPPLLESPLYPPATDSNGVNVLDGNMSFSHTIALGPENGGVRYSLVFSSDLQGGGWRDSTTGSLNCFVDISQPEMLQKHSVSVDGGSEVVGSGGSERIATDEALPSSRPPAPGGSVVSETVAHQLLIYTKSDGTVVEFEDDGTNYPFSAENGCERSRRVSRIERPNGEVLTYHYNVVTEPPFVHPFINRIIISSNLGYQIRISSVARGSGIRECVVFDIVQTTSYYPRCISSVVLVDTSVDNCSLTTDCTYTRTWPSLTIAYSGSNSMQVTDAAGRATTYTSTGSPYGAPGIIRVQTPDGRDREIAYVSPSGGGQVTSITQGAAIWTYSYVKTGAWDYFAGSITSTDPTGRTTTYTSNIRAAYGYGNPTPYLSSITDSAGQTTQYAWFGYHSYRPKSVTYPSGYKIEYAYDERHNLTSVTRTPAGGGTPIQVSMSYDATCTNILTCNQPNYRIDERGNRTDFTYDSTHGSMLSVLAPAPGAGPYASVRPQTFFEYDGGSLGVIRLVRTRTCATAQTCAGTANESVAETIYDARRRPVRTGARAGDWAATTLTTADSRTGVSSLTYSVLGDVATSDGPLPGDADTTRVYYNDLRQPVMSVSPDPDGSGPLPRQMQRIVYDSAGRPIRTETGTGTSLDGSDMTVSRFTRTTYDTVSALPVKVEEVLP